MKVKDLGETSTGLQANVAALVSYALGWVTGLIFFVLEKDNKFVRFHAMQSIVVFGAFSVLVIVVSLLFSIFMTLRLGFLYPIFTLFSALVWLVGITLWILLMIKAYQGERFKLLIAGDFAEKQLQ